MTTAERNIIVIFGLRRLPHIKVMRKGIRQALPTCRVRIHLPANAWEDAIGLTNEVTGCVVDCTHYESQGAAILVATYLHRIKSGRHVIVIQDPSEQLESLHELPSYPPGNTLDHEAVMLLAHRPQPFLVESLLLV